MTRRFPSVSTAKLLWAPLALLVALPVGALERVPAPESRPNAGLLAQAKSEIPPEILALEKKASELYERGEPQQALALIQQVMAWVNTNLPRNAPYRARNQNDMGVLLSAVGRRQEALAPTEEAVKIYRGLAKTNPAYLGDLAGSLNNLGILYSNLGRRQEALAPTEEAVKIYRELAKTNPAYLGDLATSFNNLGNCYSELGRRQEALAPTEEAVKVLRELVLSNPAYLGDLAGALNNMAEYYSQLGRPDALQTTEEAVRIRRDLARTNPAFLGDLAGSLNNLGVRYSELGRRNEALEPTEEAVKIRRELAKANPAYLGDLAGSLNNLGLRYIDLNRRQAALPPMEEAARIYRELAKTNPAYLGDLGRALTNMSASKISLGQPQEALLLLQEAVRLYQDLAKINLVYLGDLAAVLNNLGLVQLKQGNPGKARVAYEESLSLIRTLVKTNQSFKDDMQNTLNNLEDLNHREGIRVAAMKVLPKSDLTYLPKNDPVTPLQRAVLRLWPTFSGKNAGIGLLGTGFVVAREGDRAWIATARHVVSDPDYAPATRIEAELYTGPLPPGIVAPRIEIVPLKVQQLLTKEEDLIILEARGLPPDIKPLPLATDVSGRMVQVISNSQDAPSWSIRDIQLLKTTNRQLLLDGGFEPGASGSPVLNSLGQVIGLIFNVTYTSSDVNHAFTVAYRTGILASLLEGVRRQNRIDHGDLPLKATDLSYLPKDDPDARLKRSILRLIPYFSAKRPVIESTRIGGGDLIPNCCSTGFVVKRQGTSAWVATSRHVLSDPYYGSDAVKIEAAVYPGLLPDSILPPKNLEVILPELSAIGMKEDIVILEIRGLPDDIQPLQVTNSPPLGTLKIIGHPGENIPWYVAKYPLLLANNRNLLLYGSLAEGASGSPVLNTMNQVVGLVYASVERDAPEPLTYARSAKMINEKIP